MGAANATEGSRTIRRSGGLFLSGAVVLAMLVAGALAAPLMTRLGWLADPLVQFPDGLDGEGLPLEPCRRFWLGTDALGRDVLSRLVHGARISLAVGGFSMVVAALIGTILGLVAGYFGGWWDRWISRGTEVMVTLPAVLLGVALAGLMDGRVVHLHPGWLPWHGLDFRLQKGLVSLLLVIGFLSWTLIARVIRAQVVSLKARAFVVAARALGASDFRILFRHILPNVMPTVVALGVLGTAGAILLEAGLGYLGVGVPEPAPTWGSMISQGQPYFVATPHVVVIPGMAVLVTVLAFNFLGQAMQDRLRAGGRLLVWAGLFLAVPGVIGTAVAADPAGSSARRGGVLRLAYPSDWRTLDPAIAFDITAMVLQRLAFESLVDIDDNNRVVPLAADSWEVSPDQRVYRFRLRSDLRFGHGRPVEAEDYAAAIQRVLDPKTGSPGATYFRGILGAGPFREGLTNGVSGLRVLSSGELEIELEKPEFVFRYVLAMPFGSAVPRELVRADAEAFRRRPVGSGPYRIAEWRRDVVYRFERNPHYRPGREAWVDGVSVMIGGDKALHTIMLENGELDIVPDVQHPDCVRLRQKPGWGERLMTLRMAATDYFFLNTEMKPFDDVRVRRAVFRAIDRGRLARLASPDFEVARGIVPPTMPGFEASAIPFGQDLDAARRLLAEAGYPDGFQTQLWYVTTPPYYAKIVSGIAADLRKVGIDVRLEPVVLPAFEVAVRSRRRVPCGFWGWVQDYPDPGNFLDVLLNGERITETDCNNCAFFNDSGVNRLLAQAGSLVDPAARARVFAEAERAILEAAPWVPVTHQTYPVVRHPRVQGLVQHPVWLYRLNRVWIDGR